MQPSCPSSSSFWRFWLDSENLPPLRQQFLRLAAVAAPAAAILLVKIILLVQRGGWKSALTAHQLDNQVIDLRYSLNLTTMHGGWLLWVLAISGLLTSVFWKDRRKTAALAAGWLLMLFLLNTLQTILLGTPISSWMNYIIALSLPLSWLAASALEGAVQKLKTFLPAAKSNAWLPAVLLTCLALAGFTGISGIINPVTILFTNQDREAMKWINTQTAQNAIFYIDSFQWGTSITPLQRRAAGFPPSLAAALSIPTSMSSAKPCKTSSPSAALTMFIPNPTNPLPTSPFSPVPNLSFRTKTSPSTTSLPRRHKYHAPRQSFPARPANPCKAGTSAKTPPSPSHSTIEIRIS